MSYEQKKSSPETRHLDDGTAASAAATAGDSQSGQFCDSSGAFREIEKEKKKRPSQ